MNPNTGQVIRMGEPGEPLPAGFFPVAPYVAMAQLEGQRVLATRALRTERKRERQARRRGRSSRRG